MLLFIIFNGKKKKVLKQIMTIDFLIFVGYPCVATNTTTPTTRNNKWVWFHSILIPFIFLSAKTRQSGTDHLFILKYNSLDKSSSSRFLIWLYEKKVGFYILLATSTNQNPTTKQRLVTGIWPPCLNALSSFKRIYAGTSMFVVAGFRRHTLPWLCCQSLPKKKDENAITNGYSG